MLAAQDHDPEIRPYRSLGGHRELQLQPCHGGAGEPATAGSEAIEPCPYPGLAYFGPDDAALFFGRDVVIVRLEEAVSRQSFTALVGASGSGKSSVVLAGLAPRLHVAEAGASPISASPPNWIAIHS